MSDEAYQSIKDHAFTLLSFRPRSTSEIRKKLLQFVKKHRLDPGSVDLVINDLTEKKYLSEEAFIRWWIDQRNSFRPRGNSRLVSELAQKGIDPSKTRQVLDILQKESPSEYDKAKDLVRKKLARGSFTSVADAQAKISRFLTYRGFSWEVIHRVVDETVKKDYNKK